MEAERRQVTVLFADMVGFTSFSERSGEEAAFTLMRSLSKLMDEAVREQGGENSVSASGRTAPSSLWEAARPMVNRHRSSRS
jgi:class 3 adenylate cyclase